MKGIAVSGVPRSVNPYHSGLPSDHLHGQRFFTRPANHWSSRTGRNRHMTLWSGFMLSTIGGSAYFAGDTAYGDGRIFAPPKQ